MGATRRFASRVASIDMCRSRATGGMTSCQISSIEPFERPWREQSEFIKQRFGRNRPTIQTTLTKNSHLFSQMVLSVNSSQLPGVSPAHPPSFPPPVACFARTCTPSPKKPSCDTRSGHTSPISMHIGRSAFVFSGYYVTGVASSQCNGLRAGRNLVTSKRVLAEVIQVTALSSKSQMRLRKRTSKKGISARPDIITVLRDGEFVCILYKM